MRAHRRHPPFCAAYDQAESAYWSRPIEVVILSVLVESLSARGAINQSEIIYLKRLPNMSHAFSRRRFLKTAMSAAAVANVPFFGWTSPLIGQDAKTTSKNDRPILGCIGVGDRWNAVGPLAMNFGDCVAVCDVDTAMTDKAKSKALEMGSKAGRPREVEVFEDYRKLLDRKDIEVVTIVTPDHWHSKIAIDAMKAGKDVYCEKPLTLTIDEGKQVLKVLKETGRVFQVGTQQRSEMSAEKGKFKHQFLTAVALCRSGRLGKIQKVECRIGGAPTSPPIPKRPGAERFQLGKVAGSGPVGRIHFAPVERQVSAQPHAL